VLTDVIPLNDEPAERVLGLAASVETASEHPLADAIVAAAHKQGIPVRPGQNLTATPGVGVQADVDGQRLFVGRPDDPDGPAAELLRRREQQGQTAVVLARQGEPLAVLAVSDQLRDDAKAAVDQLRSLGVLRVLMLTGDNNTVAQAVAQHVGVDDWRAGLLPEHKTDAVRELRSRYGPIAMVGDGVNDGPALATADVGIAMGAAGTDVALETADVALMADRLHNLPKAIRLARRAVGNIHQNIALSLATVAVLVTAALAGWISLTSGLLLNEGTALLIIGNGLRLLRGEHPSAQTATASESVSSRTPEPR
jgi:Cd2+/Zn2+-exporting ATPase